MDGTPIISRTAALLFSILLVGCGGGGGGVTSDGTGSNDGSGNQTAPLPPSAPLADLSGTWAVTEKGASDCPQQANFTNGPANISITQDGSSLGVVTPAASFGGVIEGDAFGWSGVYPSGSGTTTIRSMRLHVGADGLVFSGSATWDWTDGSSACAGSSQVINARRVLEDGPVPATPSALGASSQSSEAIRLVWNDDTDAERGFKIERRVSADPPANFAQVGFVPAGATSYVDVGLNALTTYEYRVRSYNANGDSPYSEVVSATTQASPVDAPAAPTALTLTVASSNRITLVWTDNASNEAGVRIERSKNGITGFREIGAIGNDTISYEDAALDAATQYFYRVRAVNPAGASAYSNVATAVTRAVSVAPSAPAQAAVTGAASDRVELSWSDASDNETGFKVERSALAADVGFSQVAVLPANTTSFTDSTGVQPRTVYYYRVRAANALNGTDSDYSNTVEVRTPARLTFGEVVAAFRGDVNGLIGNDWPTPPSVSGTESGIQYSARGLGFAFCRPTDLFAPPVAAPGPGQTVYGCANDLSVSGSGTGASTIRMRITGSLFVDMEGVATVFIIETPFAGYMYVPSTTIDVMFELVPGPTGLFRLGSVSSVQVSYAQTPEVGANPALAPVLTGALARDMGTAVAAALASLFQQRAEAFAARTEEFSLD